jgi:hypothetical protein
MQLTSKCEWACRALGGWAHRALAGQACVGMLSTGREGISVGERDSRVQRQAALEASAVGGVGGDGRVSP